MKLKIIFLLLTILSTVTIAQTKVGTVDSEYIMALMPEAKIVQQKTQEYGVKLDSSFSIKVTEFQAKVADFQNKEKTMGELMKKTIVKEIQDMETEVKQYQENGNKLIQLKQNELMRPLYKKLSDAITVVAKDEKYTQILTITGNEFGYIDQKFDITNLVLENLGIVVPKAKN